MNNETHNELRSLRTDLSEWLLHFTRGSNNEAKRTLEQILSESALRSFNTAGVISFSESPIAEFGKLFEVFQRYSTPMFAPFGVAVKRDWLFEQGGRPAIYSPADEFGFVKEEHQFRLVEFNPANWDFTWQREWCAKSSKLDLDPEHTLVITPHEEVAWELTCEIDVESEYEGPEESSLIASVTRDWYAISLETVRNKPEGTDHVIARYLKAQKLDPPSDASVGRSIQNGE